MKKIALAVTLMFPLTTIAAGEIKSSTTGIVRQSECQLIAKDNSIVGATVGGTAGAVGGAMLGRAIFGKSGGWIGGLVGGAAGGTVGNEMGATETFQCKMIIESDGKQHLMQTIVNKKPEVGKTITVLEMVDGTREVM
ncbi:hypothetical protein [Pseudomonas phage PA1C]|nr:hypothetical protein [Pseudomonas phage PA1C]